MRNLINTWLNLIKRTKIKRKEPIKRISKRGKRVHLNGKGSSMRLRSSKAELNKKHLLKESCTTDLSKKAMKKKKRKHANKIARSSTPPTKPK